MDRKQKLSHKQEERTAERYRGARTPQSGAGWAIKNDVRTEDLLIENKRTDGKKSITLKGDDLEGVMTNALLTGRVGMVSFELRGIDYVVLQDDDFREHFFNPEAQR